MALCLLCSTPVTYPLTNFSLSFFLGWAQLLRRLFSLGSGVDVGVGVYASLPSDYLSRLHGYHVGHLAV